jgi:hypothetical protein
MKPTPTFNKWMREVHLFDGAKEPMTREKFFKELGKKPGGVLPDERQKHFRELNTIGAVGSFHWHLAFSIMKASYDLDKLAWEILTRQRK